jgi:hypothetical protein
MCKECKSLTVSEYEDVDEEEDEYDDMEEEDDDSCFGMHEYEHVDNLETIQTSVTGMLMVKQLHTCLNCGHDKVIFKPKEQ